MSQELLRIFILYFVLFNIAWAPKQSFAETQIDIDVLPKHIQAIVTNNNDISVDEKPIGKRVEIPFQVHMVIDEIARQLYQDECKRDDECGGLTLSHFYGSTFRIKAPNNMYLFVFTSNYAFGGGAYHFIMFDPVTKSVTQKPPSVDNKWIELQYSFMKKPIISFDDLGQDGHYQLTVTEVSHYGTDANTVSYVFFEIEPDLSLKSVFKIDTEMNDPKSASDDRLIISTLKKLASGTLKVEKFLRIAQQKDQKLGEAIFGRENPLEHFRLRSKNVLDHAYEDLFMDKED